MPLEPSVPQFDVVAGDMHEVLPKHHLRSANWLHIILGVSVFASPFVLGFSDESAMKWNDVATGLAVLLLAAGEGGPHRVGAVLNALLGAWLVASPFILGFSSAAPFWSNVIFGIAIFITALVAATHLHPNGPPAPR